MNDAEFESLKGVAVTRDPIELHILAELDRLRHQNIRLCSYVKKSGVWAHLKEIEKWAPYDFLQYFCTLYEEKYRKAYKITGNIVRAYQKIETFLTINKINNETYRKFIDQAFTRHFDQSFTPVLGHICSATLFNRLMGKKAVQTKPEDWFDIDQTMARESKAFEAAIEHEDNDFSDLDQEITAERESFR